jgi:hypothetical protein
MYLNVDIRLVVLIREPTAIPTIDKMVISILKFGEYFLLDNGG